MTQRRARGRRRRGRRPHLKNLVPDLIDLLADRGREVGIDPRRTTSIVYVQPSDGGYQVILEHGRVVMLESEARAGGN